MRITSKLLLSVTLIASSFSAVMHAQTGIGTQNPDPSAALEIKSIDNNKGLLIPRMTTVQKNAISSPATGLLVYDTTSNCLAQNNGTPALPNWICLGSSAASGWGLVGNTGTNPATNFLGSADAADVVVRTNNTEKMRITSSGKVGIGVNAPSTLLHINNGTTAGAIKIVDGTQGDGKILTSDANGVGTWRTIGAQTGNGTLPTSDVVWQANNGWQYIQYTVTVPVGRSVVYAGYLLTSDEGGNGYVTSTLSTSATSLTAGIAGISITPKYSGISVLGGTQNVGQSTWYLNNTTSSPQKLYVWMTAGSGSSAWNSSGLRIGRTGAYDEPFCFVAF